MSSVMRWGVVRTIKPQSVASHSFYVSLLTLRLCRDTGIHKALGLKFEDILEAAITHDLDEIVTGDVPSPAWNQVKRFTRDTGFKDWVRKAILRIAPWFKEPDDTRIKQIVRVCDILEAVLFLMSEIDLGNGYCKPHCEKMHEVLWGAVNNCFDMVPHYTGAVYQERTVGEARAAVARWVADVLAQAKNDAIVLE